MLHSAILLKDSIPTLLIEILSMTSKLSYYSFIFKISMFSLVIGKVLVQIAVLLPSFPLNKIYEFLAQITALTITSPITHRLKIQ